MFFLLLYILKCSCSCDVWILIEWECLLRNFSLYEIGIFSEKHYFFIRITEYIEHKYLKYFHAYKNESWLQYVNNKIQLFRMHSRKRARLHRTFDNPLEYLFHSISFTCKRHLSPTEQQANRKKTWETKRKTCIPIQKSKFGCSFCRIDCSFRQFFIVRSKNAVSPDFFPTCLNFFFISSTIKTRFLTVKFLWKCIEIFNEYLFS